MAFKMNGYSGFKKHVKGHDDGDDVKMTAEEERKHREKILEYNKNIAKPLNPTQKNNIAKRLENIDPNSEEYKELSSLLNLKKNQ